MPWARGTHCKKLCCIDFIGSGRLTAALRAAPGFSNSFGVACKLSIDLRSWVLRHDLRTPEHVALEKGSTARYLCACRATLWDEFSGQAHPTQSRWNRQSSAQIEYSKSKFVRTILSRVQAANGLHQVTCEHTRMVRPWHVLCNGEPSQIFHVAN